MPGDCPTFFERIAANRDYVNALHKLPPTYEIGDKVKFTQVIQDPVSAELIKIRLDAANVAKQHADEVNRRHKECEINKK